MFVGRLDQLSLLDSLWRKPKASLVTCRGRRRIGKSTLVEEFARRSKARLFRFEGLAPRKGMTNSRQLDEFAAQLSMQTHEPEFRFRHWSEAFATLAAKIPGTGRSVLLLDEISWMGKYDPDFAGQLKIAWDQFFHAKANLILVLCGSVSAWIAENILDNTAFVGRDSLDIVLPELSMRQCVAFWGGRGDRVPAREKLDMLSVTGGVPKFLEEIDPALSAEENVRRLCFLPEGPLFREFETSFADVFGVTAIRKKALLRVLSGGGLTASETARAAGIAANGSLSTALDELVLAGFLSADAGINPETGRPAGRTTYRLRDNYTRFYLKYIEPNADAIRAGAFRFASLGQLPGWPAITGLQFENLVLANIPALLPHIGFGHSLLRSAAPWRNARTAHGRGCQIDLLLQAPRSVCVVEIKRRERIGEEVVGEVQAKVAALGVPRGTSIRTALVFEGELSPRIEADGYFDFVIPAERLLEN